jgi:hypothetical protein
MWEKVVNCGKKIDIFDLIIPAHDHFYRNIRMQNRRKRAAIIAFCAKKTNAFPPRTGFCVKAVCFSKVPGIIPNAGMEYPDGKDEWPEPFQKKEQRFYPKIHRWS